ncbi:MAG TPA: alginate export family protein [Phycisphaerales bacterium]|nr:alginate export family protein [Phycisphaerales bacterium]
MPSLSSRQPAPLAAILPVLAGAFVLASPALAQDEQRRLERAARRLPDPAPGPASRPGSLSFTERAYLDAGGAATITGLWLDDSADNARRLIQYETAVYARGSLGPHTLFARARARYRDFSPGDSFDGRGDRWVEPWLDLYWYELTLAGDPATPGAGSADLPGATTFSVRAGRQYVDWAGGLALSENLYAVRPTLLLAGGRLGFEALAGITPSDQSVVDFDASRAEFDSDTRRGFFGGLVRYRTTGADQVYAYVLHMPDYNTDTAARFGVLTPVNFDYEATYWGLGASGSLGPDWLYLAEAVYQTGHSMSDPLRTAAQTREEISAFAGRGQLSYLLGDPGLTRLEAELLLASGDADRQLASETVGGNLAGTDDHGFNSLGLANTGLAFAPSLSNIATLRLGASTFPLRQRAALDRLSIGADVLVFAKLNDDAPIDEPTRREAFLGLETDAFVNWRLTSDLSLSGRYGVFFPGSAILLERDTRHFVMVSVTLSF